jgi:hypothetical protein
MLPLDVVEGPLELLFLPFQLNLVPVLLGLMIELDLGSLQVKLLKPKVIQLIVDRVERFGLWLSLESGQGCRARR